MKIRKSCHVGEKGRREKHTYYGFSFNGIFDDLIPEIKVTYTKGHAFLGQILNSSDVADFLKKTFSKDTIELQEIMLVLYTNRNNEIIGYYKHTVGGIHETVLDIRIVLSVALRCLAVGLVLAHNHPSGNPKPSKQDIQATEVLKKSAKLMDITLLDHLVLTNNGYYSFADEGLL